MEWCYCISHPPHRGGGQGRGSAFISWKDKRSRCSSSQDARRNTSVVTQTFFLNSRLSWVSQAYVTTASILMRRQTSSSPIRNWRVREAARTSAEQRYARSGGLTWQTSWRQILTTVLSAFHSLRCSTWTSLHQSFFLVQELKDRVSFMVINVIADVYYHEWYKYVKMDKWWCCPSEKGKGEVLSKYRLSTD